MNLGNMRFVMYRLPHFLLKWGRCPVYVIENTPKLLRVCGRYNQADSLANLLALQIPK